MLPIAFNIVASIWTAMKDIAPWVDLGTSRCPCSRTNLSGEELHAASSRRSSDLCSLIWSGCRSVMRAEVNDGGMR